MSAQLQPDAVWVLSPPPSALGELARWYACNITTIKALDSVIYRAKRELKARITSQGPEQTEAGLLTLEPDGYDYHADRVMEVMPSLIREARLTATGAPSTVYRAAEVVEEEFGDAIATVVTGVVDAVEFNRVVRMRGEAADLLEDCRVPRGKLVVRP